ncbi:hypothetical protein BX600DRAFT_54866 [Xylariales sp. PMI_506]|nr:hypothetical protein BX600DRAFT_54866 [Xylariales sp. PMI_506]
MLTRILGMKVRVIYLEILQEFKEVRFFSLLWKHNVNDVNRPDIIYFAGRSRICYDCRREVNGNKSIACR